MNLYRELLATRGVARIMLAQLLARFPFGMLSLAFLLHIERVHGSYTAAGLVLGALALGQGISGPLVSRMMGRFGMRPILVLALILCTVSLLIMALVPMAVPLTMLVGFIAGLTTPPVQPAVRTIYPKMVTSRQLTPLFSLDASAQEIIWVVGPVVTTLVSTQIGTVWGVLLAVLFLVAGGAWFSASPEVGRVRIPRSTRRVGAVLTKAPVLLSTLVGLLLVAACAALEAGVVATFGHTGAESGVVLAIFSVGSLVGGLALGHLAISRTSLAARMAIVTVGVALTLFALNFWWLSATLFVAGIGIAPAFAVMFSVVSSSVRFSETAEAFGWIGTGQLIGAGIGSSAAGVFIDQYGPHGGFAVAVIFAAAGTLVPLLSYRWNPDLRGKTVEPLPDTAPVDQITRP